MDLNQLYFDHQIALMRVDKALSCELRREGEHGASLIAGRIGCMQRALGAGAALAWETLAAPVTTDLSSRTLSLHAPNWRDHPSQGRI